MSWLNGTTILLTGATGFVGKVVLVKLLSEVPNIGKIYVLFRKKEGGASLKQRFEKEIISSKAFDVLRIRYAKGFQKFIEKIEPVIGELGEEEIFEDVTVAKKVSESIQFVINAASNVNFRWRVDAMMRANAIGVQNLMRFAKNCSQLKGFIHVSSIAALMTKEKTGEIKEEALEETIVGGLDKELLEVNNEIASIKSKYSFDDNAKLAEELTDLGLERAQEHGFPDTYHYTKALGELIVTKMRGSWPVIIVRPSVIESCLKTPFPGFIEGFKGSEPIFLAYGTGNLKMFPHNESFTWDCLPADILANVCILSTKYAMEKKPDIKVFHVCSGMENPLTIKELKTIMFKYFQDKPMTHPVTKKVIKIEEPLQNCSMQEFLQMAERDKVLKSLLKLTPYVGNQVQQQIFRTDNLQELRRIINKDQAEKFFINIKNISWESYLYQHIDACRQLLKGNISNFMLRSKL